MGGRSIFLKYWNNMSVWSYSQNRLPGGKPGISGSCVGGSNVGINLSSSPEKQQASATVIEYMTSRETQKRITMTQNVVSGIMSLYDEEEVCEVVNCKLIKSIQLVNRPIHVNNDYDSYSTFFRSHIFEFLYGNKTASQVLNEINDYTRIYNISLNTDETIYGLITLIILITLIVCMCSSLVFLFINKFEKHFSFLPKDFWFISIIGNIIVLIAGFFELGKITALKCQIRWCLFSTGFTLNLIPVLYKLIINFPEQNKYSTWINKNRFIFLGIFVFIDIITIIVSVFKPHEVTIIENVGSYNFEKCIINNSIQKLVQIFTISLKSIILIVFLFLIFIEWNIRETLSDVRILLGAIYFDIFDNMFIILSQSLNITNYKAMFIMNEIVFILLSVSNYIFIYAYRIILPFIIKDKEEEDIIRNSTNKIYESTTRRTTRYDTNSRTLSEKSIETASNQKNSKLSYISKKIIDYHYQSSTSDSTPSSQYEDGCVKSSKIDNSIISENKISGMSENKLNTTSENRLSGMSERLSGISEDK